MVVNWDTITEFENKIAEFFGSPYAVAVDSCTHGLELCLRYFNISKMTCPKRTYLSVPMLANKLKIRLNFIDLNWEEYYGLTCNIYDAATLWKKDSYLQNSFMCLSFQYQKHLSLGRGGMILCDNEEVALRLKKMSYDGRLPGIPWREQDIDTMGFHYYMTPETALFGLSKLDEAISTQPRIWSHEDYLDLTQMKIFKQ